MAEAEAEGRRLKAEGRKQKAEGWSQKAACEPEPELEPMTLLGVVVGLCCCHSNVRKRHTRAASREALKKES